jgi:hypothetical protein
MNCADFEILLSDYVDGILHGEQKSAFEQHLQECKACAEFAADCLGAVAFLNRTADVEPPPELMTRILFEVSSGKIRDVRTQSGWRKSIAKWFEPVFQPRFAMGMAMTLLSFAMLGRFTGIEVRQLRPSDIDPVKVWAAIDDRVFRTWERGLKYYESLRFVYEIQSRLKEWGDQAEEDKTVKASGAIDGAATSNGAGKGTGK